MSTSTRPVASLYPKLSELCAFLSVSDAQIQKATCDLFGAEASYHDARFDTAAVYLTANIGMENSEIFSKLRCCL